MKRFLLRSIGWFALLAAGFVFSGCSTEDELTGRPWNTPKNWESGLPSALTEGR